MSVCAVARVAWVAADSFPSAQTIAPLLCIGCVSRPNALPALVCATWSLSCATGSLTPKPPTPPHTCSNTSFIAISTLTSEMNFYTKLIGKVDPLTSQPVFKSVQIQLACQSCIDNEKAPPPHPPPPPPGGGGGGGPSLTPRRTQGFECLHLQHLIPRWQDGDKHRRLKTIMSDRPDLIVSEMGGVAFSSVDQCFRYCDLKRMFESPIPMTLEWETPFFVCVDPCAGGEHSDFAVVSFVYVYGSYQVPPPPPPPPPRGLTRT